jgi:hypothetical protein
MPSCGVSPSQLVSTVPVEPPVPVDPPSVVVEVPPEVVELVVSSVVLPEDEDEDVDDVEDVVVTVEPDELDPSESSPPPPSSPQPRTIAITSTAEFRARMTGEWTAGRD